MVIASFPSLFSRVILVLVKDFPWEMTHPFQTTLISHSFSVKAFFPLLPVFPSVWEERVTYSSPFPGEDNELLFSFSGGEGDLLVSFSTDADLSSLLDVSGDSSLFLVSLGGEDF